MSFGFGDEIKKAQLAADEARRNEEEQTQVDLLQQSLTTPTDSKRIEMGINELNTKVDIGMEVIEEMNDRIQEINQRTKDILDLLKKQKR